MASLFEKVLARIDGAGALYHRLALVVGARNTIPNHKRAFEDLMAAFHARYAADAGHGPAPESRRVAVAAAGRLSS